MRNSTSPILASLSLSLALVGCGMAEESPSDLAGAAGKADGHYTDCEIAAVLDYLNGPITDASLARDGIYALAAAGIDRLPRRCRWRTRHRR